MTGPATVAGYVVGDPHLPQRRNDGPWANVDVRGDALYNLSLVAQRCADDHADLYLPGDIFDGPDVDPEMLALVYSVLEQVSSRGLKVYYILGNHDRDHDWLRPFPGARRLDSRIHETPLGTVTGRSWAPPDTFRKSIAEAPGDAVDIGVYHQTWKELTRHGNISMSMLPRHGLAICGDVHKRQVFHGLAADVTVSPGTLTPQSVTEFEPTVVYAVTTAHELIEVPLRTRSFTRLVVDSPAAFDRAVAVIRAAAPDNDLPYHIATPFVSVRLDGPMVTTAVHTALMEAVCLAPVTLRVDVGRTERIKTAAPAPSQSLDDAVRMSGVSDQAKDLCRRALLAADSDPRSVFADRRAEIERASQCASPPQPSKTSDGSNGSRSKSTA